MSSLDAQALFESGNLNGENYRRATLTNSDLVLEFQSGECNDENSASTVGCPPLLLLTLAREH